MAKLSKSDIESRLASDTGLTIEQTSKLLTSLAKLAYSEAHAGFVLPGFGEFQVVPGAEKEFLNPFTKESTMRRGAPELRFTPDTEVEQAFLQGEFQLTRRGAGGLDEPQSKLPCIRLVPDSDDLARSGLDHVTPEELKNKLGGDPDWIQEPDEPVCCGRSMGFYGQLDSRIGDDFNVLDAGMIYIFRCVECDSVMTVTQFY